MAVALDRNMHNEKYLNLSYDVAHVTGSYNSALYDLRKQRIFSLDNDATKLLKVLLSGLPIEGLLRQRPNAEEFINYLLDKNLAKVEESRINHNEHLDNNAPTPKLEIAWIELGTHCNHRCMHCYNFSGSGKSSLSQLNIETLKKAISELYSANVKVLKFLGGEPLVFKDELYELIEYAKSFAFNTIAIHTNGTLITQEWCQFFKTNDIVVDVTVYGHTAELHDTATAVKGSFEKTIRGLKLLQEKHINSSVNLIVMPHNETSLTETTKFYKTNFPEFSFGYDYLRPSGRGISIYKQFQFLYLNRYQEHDTFFQGISRDEFLTRKSFNPCLKDKITVTESGDVFPCIMTRESTGNIRNQSISSIILSPSFKSFRELTLDKVSECQDCEFRYACTDCRPIPIGVGLGKYAKPPECRYNPYTGDLSQNYIQTSPNLVQIKREGQNGEN